MNVDFQNSKYTLNLRGKLIPLAPGIVMGIINTTPDSFFHQSRVENPELIINKVSEMVSLGATMIDIGGQSTRPGASPVPLEEEILRTIPIIKLIHEAFPSLIISIDTFQSKVARLAIENGASIINDISGGEFDSEMFQTVLELNQKFMGIGYVLMHIQGNPKTMQKNPEYGNVVAEVIEYLARNSSKFQHHGFANLIIDPGFGFGKTLAHNYELLNALPLLKKTLELPILVGLSRKSMVTRLLDINPYEALAGTITLNTLALERGADILRVHDVKEAIDTLKIVNFNRECA